VVNGVANKERILAEFLELVQVDSESGREGRLKELLKEKLGDLGLTVIEDKAGKETEGDSGNLIASLEGTTNKPAILFCAHMDTVKPGVGVKPVIRDGAVYSREGTVLGADDKAGIAAILEGLRVAEEQGLARPPIEVVFTVSEERGLMGSKHLDFSVLQARQAYVLDSVGEPGTIVIRAPRQNEVEFRVYGKAAHAGINPEDGINAIHVAAKALAGMRIGRIDEETTCNLGTVEGGKARNIVADYCSIGGEVRSLAPEKLERVTAEMVKHFQEEVGRYGARSEVRVNLLYPEMNLDPEEPVVALAKQAARNLGKVPNLIKTGGGSDASIFNGQGIRCVNLGIGMEAVHTAEEHIRIEDLVDTARLVVEIIREAGRRVDPD